MIAKRVLKFLGLLGVAALSAPAAPPAGTVLVPNDPAAFSPAVFTADRSDGRSEIVPASGQPFAQALRLSTIKPSAEAWLIGVNARTVAPVHRGDVLWVNFYSRRIESRQETGEAVAEIAFLQKDASGHEERPLERSFSCGPEWVQTSIPFVASADAAAGAASLSIRFGASVQVFELGGLTLLDCGPAAVLADLPRTVTRYEGWAADAPWRAAAAARIERIRKGDLHLRVTDAAGEPVAGATVAVRMRRHAFAWGTAVDSRHIIDDQSPDGVRYRATVEQYFNKVVFDNELKWGRWIAQSPVDRQRLSAALDWFAARRIAVRGHVMVWPSWRQTPPFLRNLANDPAALRAAVIGHIADQTARYGDRLAEWDVINETYAHHDLLQALGRDVMVDWFRAAHAGAPQVKLFYNDYTLFHGTTPDSPSQYFYDTIRFLLDHGAPIDGFGEQGHFGGNPPGPARVIAALDRFATLGLPIQISEFDVDTPDEQLQADFTRDFTIAIFSHPAVIGMVQWGFWAGAHWKPSAALWRRDWTLRPSGQAWVDLVSKTWWTNADGHTAADGSFTTRGFYGDYDIIITRDGHPQTFPLKLRPGAAQQTIVLP
jgi:GH35 family endo-1,4-beta-xylanase